jgi:hypothetical protein
MEEGRFPRTTWQRHRGAIDPALYPACCVAATVRGAQAGRVRQTIAKAKDRP